MEVRVRDVTEALPRFHLAFPVHNLDAARAFYGGVLGCAEGRSSSSWCDFNLRGHQIVAHLVDNFGTDAADAGKNPVDGDAVPVPHYGLVLSWDDWHALAERLQAAGVDWILEPRVRFRGKVGEQATMFLRDPSGNALEFKSFLDPEQLFAR